MSAFRLLYPAVAIVLGLLMLFNPRRFRDAKARKHRQRLAERMERGTDSYFEELRGLKAYPPPRTDGLWQVGGILLILAGGFMLADAMRRL